MVNEGSCAGRGFCGEGVSGGYRASNMSKVIATMPMRVTLKLPRREALKALNAAHGWSGNPKDPAPDALVTATSLALAGQVMTLTAVLHGDGTWKVVAPDAAAPAAPISEAMRALMDLQDTDDPETAILRTLYDIENEWGEHALWTARWPAIVERIKVRP